MGVTVYKVNTGIAAGSAGSATITPTERKMIRGKVLAVGIAYHGTVPPNTTDVTLRTRGKNGPAQIIIKVSNAVTDAWFYPRVATVDAAGAARLYAAAGAAVAEEFVVEDEIEALIEGADPDNNADVYVAVED